MTVLIFGILFSPTERTAISGQDHRSTREITLTGLKTCSLGPKSANNTMYAQATAISRQPLESDPGYMRKEEVAKGNVTDTRDKPTSPSNPSSKTQSLIDPHRQNALIRLPTHSSPVSFGLGFTSLDSNSAWVGASVGLVRWDGSGRLLRGRGGGRRHYTSLNNRQIIDSRSMVFNWLTLR